jgi:hypothetical protein
MAPTAQPSTTPTTNEPPRQNDGPRLVLHASATNIYFVMMIMGVIALVSVLREIWRIWRDTGGQQNLGFLAGFAVFLVLVLAYVQHKARWLIARPAGLTIIERRGMREVPWRDVKTIDDLGYWGSSPGARRYFIEFRDGAYLTFLGDIEQMARLKGLREGWTRESERARR